MSGILRSPWTFETAYAQDVYANLGAIPGATPIALWREMWALARSIEQAMKDVVNAQFRGDTAYVQARTQDIIRLRDILKQTQAQFEETANNPTLNHGISSVGDFVSKAVPGAIAAIPNAFLEAIRLITAKAGSVIWTGAVPVIGLALVALYLVTRAEGTATGRRLLR